MAILVNRVRGITGSTTTQTTDSNVISYIQSGVQYAISGIPKELQWQFASAGADITSSAGQTPDSDTVLSVTRNGLECTEIPPIHAYAQEAAYSPTSLNAATNIFPAYYKREGLVFIKPDPAAGAVGKITSVAIPTIDATTTDTWSFKVLDQVIINYACGLDCTGIASYWRKQGETLIAARSLTNVEDALSKAQAFIDDNAAIDFESYMAAEEEDDQQAQLMLQGAAQEVNRAAREIDKLQVNANDATKYYETAQIANSRADKFFEMALAELKIYVDHNSRIIKLGAAKK